MVDPKWETIVQELSGSCDTLSPVLVFYHLEELEDNQEFLEYLDSQIFQCESCGWWCPIDEQAFEAECQDCADEE